MTSKQWQLAGDAATRYQEVLVQAILGPGYDAAPEETQHRRALSK